MADLQRILTDDDPVDQQLQDPLPLGQGRLIEPRPHPLAERRQVGPDFLRRLTLGAEPLLLLVLSREHTPAHANLFATLLEFVEVNRLRLVGVEQPLLLAVESAQLRLALLARRGALESTASACRARSSNWAASVAGSSSNPLTWPQTAASSSSTLVRACGQRHSRSRASVSFPWHM